MPAMTHRIGLRLGLPAAALLAAAAPPAAVGQPPAPSTPSFFGALEVELTELVVVVLDRRGEPVLGLSREDFEVLEEGKPVPISHFAPPAPPPPAGEVPTGSEPPPVPGPSPEPREIPPPASGPRAEELFVVFVDEESLEPAERRLALLGIGDLLTDGTVTAMIVAHGLAGDRTVLEPTTDRAAALAAVEKLARDPPVGELAMSRRRLRSEMESLVPGFARLQELQAIDDLSERDRAYIMSQVRQLHRTIETHGKIERAAGENTLESLRRIALALCGRPGGKTLTYVGTGVPQTPGHDLLMAWEHQFGSYSAELRVGSEIARGLSESLVPRLAEVASFLNACGANFVAVDAAGLAPPAHVSAASAAGIEATAGIVEAGAQDRRMGLMNLAESTGGTVVPGGVGLGERLQRARKGDDAAYVLAFPTPPGRKSGAMRRIEVRLPAHDGLRVRHRRTFAALAGDSALELRLTSVLQFGSGAGAENPLEVRLEAGSPAPAEEGGFVVPVMVRVRLGRLGIEPGEREHTAHLTLAIASRDEKGRYSPVQRGEQVVKIPHDKLLQALASDAGYTFSVRVRGGRQRLGVAVRDDVTRLISVAEVALEAGAEDG
jgi:VWFA-related protein